MSLPVIFANESGNQPATQLDENFNAVANMGLYRCSATGTNAIELALAANQPDIAAYLDGMAFEFIAAGTSTAAVQIQVGTLPELEVFNQDGSASGAGSTVLNAAYTMIYKSSLNAGAGGFQLLQANAASGGALTATSLTFTTTSGIIGTTTNDSAATGSVGQYQESVVLIGAAVALTSTIPRTITSITLSAGDWDVNGFIGFATGGTTTTTVIASGISTTNNAFPSPVDSSDMLLQCSFVTNAFNQIPCGVKRISLAAPTVVYLIAQSNFATSTCTAYGTIRARRVR